MRINIKGPVLATILGFSFIIVIMAGLMIGWKWVAPATEEEIVEELATDAVVATHVISEIEMIEGMDHYKIEYYEWEDQPYKLVLSIDDNTFYFDDRESLDDFLEDIERTSIFRE